MELNPKHELFTQALIEAKGNLTAAYAQVYPKASYPSCRQGGWLLSKNVNIQRRLRELLDQNGLGLAECIKKLKALTKAEKFYRIRQDLSIRQPDNVIRLQAIQTALKIHVLLGNVESADTSQ